MPLHLPKLFRIRLENAIKSVGDGESIVDVLAVLKNEGVIESYDTILEIRVNRDKAVAIENFFMSKAMEPISISKKKRNND